MQTIFHISQSKIKYSYRNGFFQQEENYLYQYPYGRRSPVDCVKADDFKGKSLSI